MDSDTVCFLCNRTFNGGADIDNIRCSEYYKIVSKLQAESLTDKEIDIFFHCSEILKTNECNHIDCEGGPYCFAVHPVVIQVDMFGKVLFYQTFMEYNKDEKCEYLQQDEYYQTFRIAYVYHSHCFQEHFANVQMREEYNSLEGLISRQLYEHIELERVMMDIERHILLEQEEYLHNISVIRHEDGIIYGPLFDGYVYDIRTLKLLHKQYYDRIEAVTKEEKFLFNIMLTIAIYGKGVVPDKEERIKYHQLRKCKGLRKGKNCSLKTKIGTEYCDLCLKGK